MKSKHTWRLGLTLGSRTLGWTALDLDQAGRPASLLDMGVRVFSDGRDPQTRESNARARRAARGERRNRDRYHQRREKFLRQLIELGLLPSSPPERHRLEQLDPWILRARALAEPLELHEVGRALLHLQQRRGFQSTRLAEGRGHDGGKIAAGAAAARQMMADQAAVTLGELKGRPRAEVQEANRHLPEGQRRAMPPARVQITGDGAKIAYDYHPLRSMIADEFEALWSAQAPYHPIAMSAAAHEKLRETLFFQRPLKPQQVGRCLFETEEECAPTALPSAQRLAIYQELNALRVALPAEQQRSLTPDERDKLAEIAVSKPKISLPSMRRALGLPKTAQFSIEASGRTYLPGDTTHDAITANRKTGTGNWEGWVELTFAQREALAEILLGRPAPGKATPAMTRVTHQKVIARVAKGLGLSEKSVRHLLEAQDDEALIEFLRTRFGLEADAASCIARLQLAYGHQRVSRTACAKILTCLIEPDEAGNLRSFEEATLAAGYSSPSFMRSGEKYALLPYYGEVLERSVAFGSGDPADNAETRFGKVFNPTVHVSFNQLRRVVNALTERFGPPSQIILQLSHDLPLGAKSIKKLEARRKASRAKIEKLALTLNSLGQANTYHNRLKLRLWDEVEAMGSRCPLTGQRLSQDMLWSGDLEAGYILPYTRTLDDSLDNKMLALREANLRKAQRSPWEALELGIFDKETLKETINALPAAKAWRFGPDAMQRSSIDELASLDLQLRDRRRVARMAAQYLGCLGADVRTVNGRLTGDLRYLWSLNGVMTDMNQASPDDEGEPTKRHLHDHRRHAIDAFVVAMTDEQIAGSAAQAASTSKAHSAAVTTGSQHLLAEVSSPFEGYLNAVAQTANRMIVSHKPDHGTQGRLHEETNYGVVRTQSGDTRLVTRKLLEDLSLQEIRSIGDDRIRREVLAETDGLGDKDRRQALIDYSQRMGHKRVRVHKVQADFERIEHGPDGKGNMHARNVIARENHCMDIVETPDGEWHCFAVTRFLTHKHKVKDAWKRLWTARFPDGRLIMRVHNNDLILLVREGEERVMRVVRLNPAAKRFFLAETHEAGNLEERHNHPNDHFRWDFAHVGKLKSRRARLVRVGADGQLVDPGFSDQSGQTH